MMARYGVLRQSATASRHMCLGKTQKQIGENTGSLAKAAFWIYKKKTVFMTIGGMMELSSSIKPISWIKENAARMLKHIVRCIIIKRFILDREGPELAQEILNNFAAAKESLQALPGRERIPPELARINVFTDRERQIPPWRMPHEVSEPENRVYVHTFVDGRRDLPAILAARLLQPSPDFDN